MSDEEELTSLSSDLKLVTYLLENAGIDFTYDADSADPYVETENGIMFIFDGDDKLKEIVS